jgi:hypothetical protein
MSRIRSLHPGQWTDDKFVQMSPWAQLLALAIRNFCDDNGIFEWNPVKLKMWCLPAATVDMVELLDELVEGAQVRRYVVGERAYGQMRNFARFQRIKKPKFIHPVPPGLPHGYDLNAAYGATSSEAVPDQSAINRAHGATMSELVPNQSGKTAAEVGGMREEEGGNDVVAEARDPKREVLQAIGVWDDARWVGSAARVEAWLAHGADLDKDILPTIRRLMATRTSAPHSIKYFENAVMDAKATREAPVAAGKVNGHGRNWEGRGSDQARRRAGLAGAIDGTVIDGVAADAPDGTGREARRDPGNLETP